MTKGDRREFRITRSYFSWKIFRLVSDKYDEVSVPKVTKFIIDAKLEDWLKVLQLLSRTVCIIHVSTVRAVQFHVLYENRINDFHWSTLIEDHLTIMEYCTYKFNEWRDTADKYMNLKSAKFFFLKKITEEVIEKGSILFVNLDVNTWSVFFEFFIHRLRNISRYDKCVFFKNFSANCNRLNL